MQTTALTNGSKDAINTFCRTLRVSPDTVEELVSRGLLHFNGETWRLGDSNNGTTRRLDGRKWKSADNAGHDWHKLIGLDDVVQNDRRRIMFVLEGSKDAIAAAEIAHRSGILPQTGIICALGSGYRPLKGEIDQLRGRSVLLIGDNDVVGIETTQIVSQALRAAGVEHKIWDWTNQPAKDLYDFLFADSQDSFFNIFSSLSLPSQGSRVQGFKGSRQENGEGSINVSFAHFVAPFVVTEKGTGNRKSFDLARAVRTTNSNMSMDDLNKIHHEWFTGSLPLLPPDADEDKSFQGFLKRMRCVRYTPSALQAACERAENNAPPFIPALDGNVEATKLASLCRELQRDARDRPFICSIGVAQQFVGLRWREQARWLLHQLELNDVLECVERGVPKGKPTKWRYKLPVE